MLKVVMVLAGVLIAGGWLVWRNTAQASDPPAPGVAAPNFSLADQSGKVRTLADFGGHWLVLYFYPKDNTPGCTRQACTFRDDVQKLGALGARVVGISVDDSVSHAAFARKYSLPFPLLADGGGETAARYGSLRDFGLFRFARRNTFLIDPQGRIARVYLGADAGENSAQVIADLTILGAKTKTAAP